MKRIFRQDKKLYLITDRTISGETHVQIARKALSAGIRVIQLREKRLSRREIFLQAQKLRELTARAGALFIVNDYVDIACAVKADGVHLGQDDLPLDEARSVMGRKRIIGISTHSVKQAIAAQSLGANYIGFGPIFSTSTKDAGKPKGLGALNKIRGTVDIPIVAIGGITCENVRDVLDSGADACAIASALLSGNIRVNVKRCLQAVER